MEGKKPLNGEEFRGARLRILGTDPESPEDGRVFVWTKEGWFERLTGTSGDVAFTPIAESEVELHEIVARDAPAVDLVELGGEFRKMVSEEFMEQAPSYRDSPMFSEKDSFDADDQEYHVHDL